MMPQNTAPVTIDNRSVGTVHLADSTAARRFNLADAINRALRTLWNGVGWDIAIAVSFALSATIGGMEWTTAWWSALGTALFKTIVMTITSYIARRKAAPKTGVQV
jgi:hypothetical protein